MTCWLCDLGTDSPGPTCKNKRCQICVKTAMVDVEINRTVAALQHLLTKRRDLRSEHNNAHDITHRLPLEIKSRIFELVLPTRDEWGRIVQDGESPSYLSSICRNWCDIARSIPFLWSTIPIVLGTSSTSYLNWVNFVYDWIQRSRNLPLTLYIIVYVDERSAEDLEEPLNGILKGMGQYLNEWRSLSLEIPSYFLYLFYEGDNDFKSHLLTVRRLRISCTDYWDDVNQTVNPIMSPEKIEMKGLPFKSLQISWNYLTSAKFSNLDLEEVTQLFQHASQMINCSISQLFHSPGFAVPPIIHRMLQTLHLCRGVIPVLLDSLTLSCLHAIETNIVGASSLPSLVYRSSCPLTRTTFFEVEKLPSDLQPLPGVTDLVLENVSDYHDALQEFLLEGYFPDLRHLTLPFQPFVILWMTGFIPSLLDRNWPRPNEVSLHTIFVVYPQSDSMWDSEFGGRLKAFRSSISLREGGFELSIPEVLRGGEDN